MFHELMRTGTDSVRSLFAGLPFSFVIDAVIAGNTPARLWADDPARPGSLLMWDTHHGYYLVGDPGNAAFNRSAQEWIAEQTARGPFYAKIHYTPVGWEAMLPDLLQTVSVERVERVIYALQRLNIPDWAGRVPPGFRMAPITGPLLASPIAQVDRVIDEISGGWRTTADFLAKGFGFCLVEAPEPAGKEQIVCWCTAEYVGSRQLGIGIETLPDYQRRGLATLTAAAFAEQCQAHGMTPYWDAFARNEPSLAVATKVGFEPVAEYAVFLARPR